MSDDFAELRRHNRNRVAAVVGAIVATALVFWLFNRGTDRGPVIDCGDLDSRAADAEPLPHDRYCTLSGTVETELVLTMGRENKAAVDEATRKSGLRYFVKLPGPIVAALPGGRPDVESFKRDSNHLKGFRVEGTGRIFDPLQEKGYEGTGNALRQKFGIAADAPMRMFDASDQPPEG